MLRQLTIGMFQVELNFQQFTFGLRWIRDSGKKRGGMLFFYHLHPRRHSRPG